MSDYADAHPEPRSEEGDIILKRFNDAAVILKQLKANKDEIDFAQAFARVAAALLTADFLIIDWLAKAIAIQRGAKERFADEVAVLRDAVTAIPKLIRAVEVAHLHHSHIEHLKELKGWLGTMLVFHEGAFQTMSPRWSHSHTDALRYFVTMVDHRVAIELRKGKKLRRRAREGEKLRRQARTADLALIATVALDNTITEKAVNAQREPVKL